MAHRAEFIERIEIINGKIYLIYNAVWKNRELDVFKQDLDSGRQYARNLYFTYLAGYTVSYPGEKERYYGITELEEWSFTMNINICCKKQIPYNVDDILQIKPHLKYFFKKLSEPINYQLLFTLIKAYEEHPEIENLIELKLYRLALNKSFIKLKNKKPIINFIKNNKSSLNQYTTLKDIQTAIKYDIPLSWIPDFNLLKLIKNIDRKKILSYIKKHNINTREYLNYIEMCQKAQCDITDSYWLLPHDFNSAHDTVMEYLHQIELNKQKAREEALYAVGKKFSKYNKIIDGYRVFIPDNMNDIKHACDDLHQCLISCDYVGKMINKKCILVFIWQDDTPLATAEVFYNKSVGQFYGNEQDRDNCLPSDDIKRVLDKWIYSVRMDKYARF